MGREGSPGWVGRGVGASLWNLGDIPIAEKLVSRIIYNSAYFRCVWSC